MPHRICSLCNNDFNASGGEQECGRCKPHFGESVGEVDLLDVLCKNKTLFVQIPTNADPKMADALNRVAVGIIQQVVIESELKTALRPMLDNMKFDLEAAEHDAMPPGKA